MKIVDSDEAAAVIGLMDTLKRKERMDVFIYIAENGAPNFADLLKKTGLHRSDLNHHLQSLKRSYLISLHAGKYSLTECGQDAALILKLIVTSPSGKKLAKFTSILEGIRQPV